MAIPIITVHTGYHHYLVYVLAQAKATNHNSEVILLGDSANSFLSFVRHEEVSDYFEEAECFEEAYRNRHMSPNAYQYELICFQRWFAIKKYMEVHQMSDCVHIDSDVLLYADMTEEHQKYKDFDLALVKAGCGHTSFMSYAGIVKFTQFVMDTYTDPARFAVILEQQELRRQKEPHLSFEQVGGISDMSLFRQFYQENAQNITLTSNIVDDSVYDFKIDSAAGEFEMQDGLKKVHWVGKEPFVKQTTRDQLIKFNSLHFQGASKRIIRDYFTGQYARVLPFLLQGFVFQQLPNKLLRAWRKWLTFSNRTDQWRKIN